MSHTQPADKHGRATPRMKDNDDVTHNSDEVVLTSHFDSGRVSPGFSSPAGLPAVGEWGSGGGGMGIGRGMG